MPRRKIDGKVGGRCKIRKRASSSSTSSSSLARNCRLKRAILVAKRAGSTTPVPTWKMASRSPSLSHGNGGESQISARRLAASLWEINASHSGGDKKSFDGDSDPKMIAKLPGGHHSQSPVSKNKDGSMPPRHHRRKSSAISDKFQLLDMDSLTNGDSVEVGSRESSSSINSRLKDVSGSLAASKEIVKVLFRLWGRDEHNTSRMTLVSALRVEIDRARRQVEHLIHEQRHGHRDVEILLKELAMEKAEWKRREEERVLDATSAMAREIETERKLRRQTERLNKRLGRELEDTRKRLSEALKDDREEVEREREMLQLADVLREERVQMKLAEASYEYEEKNAALERLRTELQLYLGGKQRSEDEDEYESELDSIELNMDSASKSYKWSFVNEEEQQQGDESRRASVDEVFKGRRSLSEKIQWENICLTKKGTDNNNNNNNNNNNSNRKQGSANGFERGRLSEVGSEDERREKQGCKDTKGNSSMRFSVSLADHFQGELSKGNGKT